MKKLMVMLAAVAMAAVSQAAMVDWEVVNKAYPFAPTDTVNPAKATPRTSYYTGMLFLESDRATVEGLLANGDLDGLNDYKIAQAKSAATGKIANPGNEVTGASVTAFSVIFDTYTSAMTMDDVKNYIVSASMTQSTYSGSDPATKLSFGTDQFAGKSWQAIAAPEPTSGLLLLLGFAGLALKRRRA